MGMSTAEFENQKADARKRFYIDRDEDIDQWVIIDRNTGKTIGSDGGEPEDQLLVRNWSWVVDALNALSDEQRETINIFAGFIQGIVDDEGICTFCRSASHLGHASFCRLGKVLNAAETRTKEAV